MRFYLGSHTDAAVKGIYLVDIDPTTAKLGVPQLVAETAHPTFMALSPDLKYLYAICESKEFAAEHQAAITAYAVDPKTRSLTKLNTQPSGGQGACFISTDRTGQVVLVANYSSAHVQAIPVAADGSLREPSSLHHQEGTGPNQDRQQEPHAHSILVDPTNRFALSADLGADLIYIYAMNLEKSSLTPVTPFHCPPGAGPRHLAFHPNGKLLYVINELDATVLVLDWDASAGTLTHAQTILSLPADYVLKDNTASEIAILPNAKHVYAANRGHDSIAQFSVDAKNGTLKLVGHTSTHGHGPRHFGIDPTGRVLVVANQHASNVTSFKIDPSTGTPEFLDSFSWNKPMCIRFLPDA